MDIYYSLLSRATCRCCSMSIEQKLCEMKLFQLQSMPNAIGCMDQRFAIKNSCRSCLALIIVDIQPGLSENDNPARKKAFPGCEIL